MNAPDRTAGPGRRTVLRGALAGWLALGLATADAQEALEAGVKAAYLYKFIGFVDWPPPAFAAADSPSVIGVMGDDEVLAELQRLVVGRSVNGRPLVARRTQPGEAVPPLHVLYLGRHARTAEALKAVAGRPVLTITDSASGIAEGAVLNFRMVQGKVRFEASLPAAERAGLKLSARLLAVAERVLQP